MTNGEIVLGYLAMFFVAYGVASEFEDDPAAAFLYAVLWPITILVFLGVKLGRLVK
jgi:hypothetical protein